MIQKKKTEINSKISQIYYTFAYSNRNITLAIS